MKPTWKKNIPAWCVGFVILLLMAPPWVLVVVASSAPWQHESGRTRRSSVVEDALYADLPLTVFAPSGRLVALEHVVPKVRQPWDVSNSLIVALHCHQGVVVVASLPQSPYLYDPKQNTTTNNATTNQTLPGPLWILDDDDNDDDDQNDCDHNDTRSAPVELASSTQKSSVPTSPPFCRLGPRIFGVTAGPAIDAQIVRSHLHDLADAMMRQQQQPQQGSAAYLARRWADVVHQRTVQNSDRPLWACHPLLIGPHQLWQVEPTGQFYQCRATVVGRNAIAAEQLLLRILNETTTAAVVPHNISGTDDEDDATTVAVVSDSSSHPPRHGSKSHLHAAIQDLTVKQAFLLASKTILEALSNHKSDHAAIIRIQGLFIGEEREDWYTQKQLEQLLQKEQEEDTSVQSLG